VKRKSLLLAAITVNVALAAPTGFPADPGPGAVGSGTDEWPVYGHDPFGTRYSPLTEITRNNVQRLEVAWTYHTGETDSAFATRAPTSFEATPIVVDGVLYVGTPLGRVIALNPETGAEQWVFNPEPAVDRDTWFGDFTSRGVSTWLDSTVLQGAACRRRIFVPIIDGRLIALDAQDGKRCADFGRAGAVDLRWGLRNLPHDPAEYETTSPPTVVNGVVVVGSAVADNNRTDAASGEVRGFDARTGRLRWSWDPVAQWPADRAWRTWIGPSAHRTGAANAWSVFAADPDRDLVIVPTGSASPDYFGGERLGSNLYANSVVAIRASTGELVWHFQTVHHDLWDYDNASPPALVTLQVDGKEVPAVLQATKTGQLFVLDRRTGTPLLPVTERPVPSSDVPGETAWPTQPFSAWLPPLSPQGVADADVWGATRGEEQACRKQLATLRNEGIFTPPSLEGSLVIPSNIGGAHWGGVAYDPSREIVVVPTNRIAAVVQLIPRNLYSRAVADTSDAEFTDMQGTPYVMRREMWLSPHRLPCTPPPFGSLVALNLRTRVKVWDVPLGDPHDIIAARTGMTSATAAGTPNLGGPIVTAGGVVFIAATLDAYLRAFDIDTGVELWKGKLPAGGKATPVTYRLSPTGRQYVVVAAGGDGKSFGRGDAVVAFALPR
jgi:quinoprotein glucose dehydrogenase